MKCILVVDDEESVRRVIVKLLTREGLQVIEANEGHTGLALAREHRPELIISDVEMPGLNGHGLLRGLQADAATAAIPVIFLTGKNAREDVRLGMNLGAEDYITKPFQQEEVLVAVQSRLARHDRLTQRYEEKLDQLHHHLTTTLPHELRTPLAGILGYSEILLEQPDQIGRDEVRWAAQAIRGSAERLQRCVEGFLIYAELASPNSSTSKERGATESSDMSSCVMRACATRTKLHDRGKDMRITCKPARVAVSEDFLQRIVEELVDNACRYSAKGTAISVTVETDAKTATLAVHDRGRGLSAEQIRELGAFVQFDRQRYEQQGLGLGLTITRRIVERFGGSFQIHSVLGEGTIVTVTLPAAIEDVAHPDQSVEA